MDASEIIELETSRAGWRVLSIVLISLISAIVIGGDISQHWSDNPAVWNQAKRVFNSGSEYSDQQVFRD